MPYEVINTAAIIAENSTNTNSVGYGILPQKTGMYEYPFETSYALVDQARENLITLLLTTRGERLYHSNFGSNLQRLVFNNISDELRALIQDDITDSVNLYLAYISILEIDIQTYETNPELEHEIVIAINWEVGSFVGDPVHIFVDSDIVTVG